MLTQLRHRINAAYDEVDRITAARLPYVFGGGHNAQFAPSDGIPPRDLEGYDCSSFASRVLHVAGLLAKPHATFPFDTHAFELWGAAGEGIHLTLWVVDAGGVDHCALDFHDMSRPQRWAQAAHTGTLCGWLNFDPAGFHPRHWPGT